MRRVLLSICLSVGGAQLCYAADTLFLAQEFHLKGSFYRDGFDEQVHTDSFDVTADHPLSQSVTDGDGWAQASGWTTILSPRSAEVGISGSWFSGDSWDEYPPEGDYTWPYYSGYADISGTWTFRPAQSEMLIYGNWFAQFIWALSFKLTDLTTGEIVPTDPMEYPDFYYELRDLDPAHLYELRLSIHEFPTSHMHFYPNDGYCHLVVTLDGLAVVPVPGALWLGCLGVLCARRMIRR
jgi:hypothetical protein